MSKQWIDFPSTWRRKILVRPKRESPEFWIQPHSWHTSILPHFYRLILCHLTFGLCSWQQWGHQQPQTRGTLLSLWSSRLNYFQGSLIKTNCLRGPCQQIHPSTRLQASEVHRLCVVPETCLSLVSWPWNSGWQCCPHPSPCPVLRNLSPASYTWRHLA